MGKIMYGLRCEVYASCLCAKMLEKDLEVRMGGPKLSVTQHKRDPKNDSLT